MISARILPFLLAISGLALLCTMDAMMKALGGRYPTFQLAFLRFAFGWVWAMAVIAVLRPPFPSTQTIRINTLRGLIGVVTATTFFYAIQTLPLADAIAFSFLSPLFLALFGALILGEVVGRFTLLGLVIGFFGMLVMVFGQGLGSNPPHLPGVAAAIVSAICYAFGLVLLRQRAQQDALIIIVLFQCMVPMLVLSLPAWWVWKPVVLADAGLFFVVGAFGVAGHLLLANAFKRAEAARLAPTEYSALLFAVLLGYVFFGEVPGWPTLFGSGLIILGTLAAMRQPAPALPKPL